MPPISPNNLLVFLSSGTVSLVHSARKSNVGMLARAVLVLSSANSNASLTIGIICLGSFTACSNPIESPSSCVVRERSVLARASETAFLSCFAAAAASFSAWVCGATDSERLPVSANSPVAFSPGIPPRTFSEINIKSLKAFILSGVILKKSANRRMKLLQAVGFCSFFSLYMPGIVCKNSCTPSCDKP